MKCAATAGGTGAVFHSHFIAVPLAVNMLELKPATGRFSCVVLTIVRKVWTLARSEGEGVDAKAPTLAPDSRHIVAFPLL
jgi:hypothetical protein